MQLYSMHLRLHFQPIPFLFCSPLFRKNANKNHSLLTTPTYPTAIWVSFRAHLAPRWLRRVPIQQGGRKKFLSEQQLWPQTQKWERLPPQLTLIISVNRRTIGFFILKSVQDTYFWNSHSLLSSGHTWRVLSQREMQWKWKACWKRKFRPHHFRQHEGVSWKQSLKASR